MNKNSSKSECEPPTKKSKLDLNKSSQAEKEIVIKKDASGHDGNLSVQNKTWINVETEELTIDSPELQPEEAANHQDQNESTPVGIQKSGSRKYIVIRGKKSGLEGRKAVKTDFQCNFCRLKFTTYLSFKYHFINLNEEKVEEAKKSGDGLLYRCETCDYEFESASLLQNHMLDVDHNKKVSSDTEQIEEFIQKPKHPCFVCCVCKARFGHMQILHVHMKLGKCKESANEDDNDVLPIDEDSQAQPIEGNSQSGAKKEKEIQVVKQCINATKPVKQARNFKIGCSLCPQLFLTMTAFGLHARKSHGQLVDDETISEFIADCETDKMEKEKAKSLRLKTATKNDSPKSFHEQTSRSRSGAPSHRETDNNISIDADTRETSSPACQNSDNEAATTQVESLPKPSSKPAIRIFQGENQTKVSLLQTALTKPSKPPQLPHLMPDILKLKSKIQPSFVIGKTTETVSKFKPGDHCGKTSSNPLPWTKIQPALYSTVPPGIVLNLIPVPKPSLADLIASKTRSNLPKLESLSSTQQTVIFSDKMPSTSILPSTSTAVTSKKTPQPKLVVVRKPESGSTESEPRVTNAWLATDTAGSMSSNYSTSIEEKVVPEPKYKVLSLGPKFSKTLPKIIVINDPPGEDEKLKNPYSLPNPATQQEVVSSKSLKLEAKKPKALSRNNPSLKSESLLFYKVIDKNDVSKVLVTDDLSDFDFQDGKFRVEVKKHATSEPEVKHVRLIEKKKLQQPQSPPNLVLLRPTKKEAECDPNSADPLSISQDPLETPEDETFEDEVSIKEEQITFEN